MSDIPQIRRLLTEDFNEQKSWIAKLFSPLNVFMDGVLAALSRGITIRQNMAADIKTFEIDKAPTVADYWPVSWSLPVPPLCVHVASVTRKDGADFTLAAAVGVQWKYDSIKGFRITNIVGVTPSTANVYVLTLTVFTG